MRSCVCANERTQHTVGAAGVSLWFLGRDAEGAEERVFPLLAPEIRQIRHEVQARPPDQEPQGTLVLHFSSTAFVKVKQRDGNGDSRRRGIVPQIPSKYYRYTVDVCPPVYIRYYIISYVSYIRGVYLRAGVMRGHHWQSKRGGKSI